MFGAVLGAALKGTRLEIDPNGSDTYFTGTMQRPASAWCSLCYGASAGAIGTILAVVVVG